MAVRIEPNAEPIPGYRLIERLGGGGFGEVWKCEAPGGLHKAIKFVYGDLQSNEDGGQRAEQELKALARVKSVRHPYILSLERYDIIEGQLVIVMELADRNLWDRYKECRSQGLPGIPRDELLLYVEEAAEALDLMNGLYQLQHLDIKPQNLFLVHNHIKVADFGLVKDLEGIQTAVTGGITPVYAAPETFDGWVSRFCDQYSLAICYQELLTGQRPFCGGSVRQLIMQHLQGQPNVSPLPAADRAIILRSLSKKPDERFPNCKEMVRLLGQKDTDGEGRLLGSSAAQLMPEPDSAEPAEASNNPPSTASGAKSSDSAHGTTHLIRNGEIVPARSQEVGKAPPEVNGDGALFPALVLGVGQVGLNVLQRLRANLTQRFRSLDAVRNIRLLLLDTDPEVMRSATRGPSGAALAANEVMLVPLNRPSHYIKRRDDRPPLESWINPHLLYRIPRSQVTTGVRALGRLAFCENHRNIARRLRQELDFCLNADVLAGAARQTGLGMRSNRPRVYIVTSLAGGTGGGMFLDLAYTVRALLKQLGYAQPDVVGLLLLPAVDGQRTRVMTLGNAYAALTELGHFASPDTCFTARYLEREPPVQDADPPFSQSFLLRLPEETDEVSNREAAELAGQFLYRDLCSSLGRAADLARAGLSSPPWPERGLYYSTFGLFRLSFPRQALLAETARCLCLQLVSRWMSKDSKPVRDQVQTWIQEQWHSRSLSADNFIERVQEACREQLYKDPETDLLAPVESLAQTCRELEERCASAGRRRGGGASASVSEIPITEIEETLKRVGNLIGRPEDDSNTAEPSHLVSVLRQTSEELAAEWSQTLAELVVQLLEDPGFRLAGAEEATRQLVATIEQVLQRQEPLAREMVGKSEAALRMLKEILIAPAGSEWKTAPIDRVIALLRNYARWRWQALQLHHTTGAFLSLRGHLSDELRELGFCRVRLAELQRCLEAMRQKDSDAARASRQLLLPPGCDTLPQAIEQVLASVDADTLLELDQEMEEMLRSKFGSLVQVCLASADTTRVVLTAMFETAEQFAVRLLPELGVADLFEARTDAVQRPDEVGGFYDEAAPELLASRQAASSGPGDDRELCLVAAPAGPAGERLIALARGALHEADPQMAPSEDDILVYREVTNQPLADLEQMGPLGRDAYRQMSAAEHFTPHTRTDITFKPIPTR
jgi:serine/threonine protein kinase